MRILIVDYDPRWPDRFAQEAAAIRSELGPRALAIEHPGSTSVPGLAAKPAIDVVLAVANSASEESYAPNLEAAGYAFRLREPDWFEHRLLRRGAAVNLHVFSAGCAEIGRMLAFRNWLRANPADREFYAAAKRALAQREWTSADHYAEAKTAVIRQITARITQSGR